MAREEEQTYPTITVKLFASSREIIGKDKITLKLSEKMTALDLRRMILEQYPQIAKKIQFVIAINRKIAITNWIFFAICGYCSKIILLRSRAVIFSDNFNVILSLPIISLEDANNFTVIVGYVCSSSLAIIYPPIL